MKFKAGDTVVLRSDLIRGQMYGEYYLLSEMYKLRGKTVKIIEAKQEGSQRYRIEECPYPFFTDEMFLDKNEYKYLNL